MTRSSRSRTVPTGAGAGPGAGASRSRNRKQAVADEAPRVAVNEEVLSAKPAPIQLKYFEVQNAQRNFATIYNIIYV
jgi:hypothetical protein